MRSSPSQPTQRSKGLSKHDAPDATALESATEVEAHGEAACDVDQPSELAAAEREEYLVTIEAYAKKHFMTLVDLQRLLRVQTLKSAKEYESPEAKLRRFIKYLQFALTVQLDAPYGADWPPRGGYEYILGVQYLLRHCQNDKTPMFDDLNNGSPGAFFERMESLQGAGLDDYYLPRVWLRPVMAEWKEWVKRDANKKRQRRTRGRGRDPESGQFEPTRDRKDGTFTPAHPSIFSKK